MLSEGWCSDNTFSRSSTKAMQHHLPRGYCLICFFVQKCCLVQRYWLACNLGHSICKDFYISLHIKLTDTISLKFAFPRLSEFLAPTLETCGIYYADCKSGRPMKNCLMHLIIIECSSSQNHWKNNSVKLSYPNAFQIAGRRKFDWFPLQQTTDFHISRVLRFPITHG